MAVDTEACVKKMNRILDILVEVKRFKSGQSDEVMYQFGQFLDYCAVNPDFHNFDPSEPTLRVDTHVHKGCITCSYSLDKFFM